MQINNNWGISKWILYRNLWRYIWQRNDHRKCYLMPTWQKLVKISEIWKRLYRSKSKGDNWREQPVQMRSQSCRWLNGLIKRLIYLRVRCNVALCEIYKAPGHPSARENYVRVDHRRRDQPVYVFYAQPNNVRRPVRCCILITARDEQSATSFKRTYIGTVCK